MSSPRALAVIASLAVAVALACSSPPAQDARPGATRIVASAPPWTPGDPQPPGPPDAAYRFWIGDVGPTGPLFSGPQQYPFLCTTYENGLGQPLPDPGATKGSAVFPETNGVPDFAADPVGRAPSCRMKTRVDYLYFSATAKAFLPLLDNTAPPADVERITVGGKTIPFVVRLERGTVDRFIYSIAMLAPYRESLDSPARLDERAWNRKLVYSFQGGVAIGHTQGFLSSGAALNQPALRRGYAVAYSTGNSTDTHYNLVLAGETALMVKNHFVATYGRPKYTVGVGGSGGSIQQYAIAQNLPGLLDAIVPQYSYSDMITQTIYVGDCELLERYFDMSWTLSGHTSRWGSWADRHLVEGLATSAVAVDQDWSASPYAPTPGYSECIKGWRGLTPLAINPRWAPQEYFDALHLYRYPQADIDAVHWTHWDDLGNVYPKDANGYAEITWDNVGVQYGLGALQRGELSPAEFLDLNACVGSWKDPDVMTANDYPWNPSAPLATLDPWSMEDMNLSPSCSVGGPPAPRRTGSIDAMHAAYESGHVFRGQIDLPIVDMRHYLDPVLDMHHAQQSFATRQRMTEAVGGHPGDQVIWFAECSDLDKPHLRRSCAFDPTGAAFDTIDRWIANIRENPDGGVLGNKPAEAVDACFAGDGSLIYAGPDAWAGILDGRPAGPCTQHFPLHTTSRIEAGGAIRGEVFKCALKSVDDALADGTYGTTTFSADQVERLKVVFPDGVCDYSKPDVGRPAGL